MHAREARVREAEMQHAASARDATTRGVMIGAAVAEGFEVTIEAGERRIARGQMVVFEHTRGSWLVGQIHTVTGLELAKIRLVRDGQFVQTDVPLLAREHTQRWAVVRKQPRRQHV